MIILFGKLFSKKKKDVPLTPEEESTLELRTFFDMIAPNNIQFFADYFVCGNTFRSVWAVIGFNYVTPSLALLSELSAKTGVTLHIYNSELGALAEKRVIEQAEHKNTQSLFSNKSNEAINAMEAQAELAELLRKKRKDKEPLLELSIYIELKTDTLEHLRILQEDVRQILAVDKIEYDKMYLTQKEGFLACMPGGYLPQSMRNKRIYPASSAANLFPLAYTGKLDATGFRLGKDKNGGDIIVDPDARSADKTNGHCIILGNPGMGKSYLTKLLKTFALESGKNVIIIDPSEEYREIVEKLGGSYVDIASGFIINPLEVRDQANENEIGFANTISRHISFLRDFFSTYKRFTPYHLDIIEIMLKKLYADYGITDSAPTPKDGVWPTLKELYALGEKLYTEYDSKTLNQDKVVPFTKSALQEVLLSISSICQGPDSEYFNGKTNIPSDRIVAFGFKKLLDTNENLLSATLFNALSYMHNAIASNGNTVGVIDELHLFLRYPVAINYIRSDMKQGRKKDSYLILATQNIEDLNLPGIRELTKPLFTIPTHSFFFYPGNVNAAEFMELTNMTAEEFALIKSPRRGSCLYRCGSERFHLQVEASPTKAALIGKSGGR